MLTLCLVCFNLSNIPAISKKGEEDERGTIIDRETLSNIKTRLQNMENALGQSRTDLQTVKDGANQQVVALTQTHAEEKGSLTTKIDFHAQKIADLESQLAESGKSSKSK